MKPADYCCPWCGYEAPVPSLLVDHKKRCPERPSTGEKR